MMVIIFRAWHLPLKKWHYFRVPDYFFNTPEIDGKKVHWLDYENWGMNTGLHDKNGKEIYEGDIIIFGNLPKNEFFAQEVKFGYYDNEGRYEDSVSGNGWYLQSIRNKQEIIAVEDNFNHHEIIGNIYENPELLNK